MKVVEKMFDTKKGYVAFKGMEKTYHKVIEMEFRESQHYTVYLENWWILFGFHKRSNACMRVQGVTSNWYEKNMGAYQSAHNVNMAV